MNNSFGDVKANPRNFIGKSIVRKKTSRYSRLEKRNGSGVAHRNSRKHRNSMVSSLMCPLNLNTIKTLFIELNHELLLRKEL